MQRQSVRVMILRGGTRQDGRWCEDEFVELTFKQCVRFALVIFDPYSNVHSHVNRVYFLSDAKGKSILVAIVVTKN